MIDDIVEMVLKEARARDRKSLFVSVFTVFEEVFEKVNLIVIDHMIEERRKEHDEDKG
jgi:hypothetical protein